MSLDVVHGLHGGVEVFDKEREAEADDAQRLPVELEAGVLGAIPAARLQRGVALRDVAGEGEHQAEASQGRQPEGPADGG